MTYTSFAGGTLFTTSGQGRLRPVSTTTTRIPRRVLTLFTTGRMPWADLKTKYFLVRMEGAQAKTERLLFDKTQKEAA